MTTLNTLIQWYSTTLFLTLKMFNTISYIILNYYHLFKKVTLKFNSGLHKMVLSLQYYTMAITVVTPAETTPSASSAPTPESASFWTSTEFYVVVGVGVVLTGGSCLLIYLNMVPNFLIPAAVWIGISNKQTLTYTAKLKLDAARQAAQRAADATQNPSLDNTTPANGSSLSTQGDNLDATRQATQRATDATQNSSPLLDNTTSANGSSLSTQSGSLDAARQATQRAADVIQQAPANGPSLSTQSDNLSLTSNVNGMSGSMPNSGPMCDSTLTPGSNLINDTLSKSAETMLSEPVVSAATAVLDSSQTFGAAASIAVNATLAAASQAINTTSVLSSVSSPAVSPEVMQQLTTSVSSPAVSPEVMQQLTTSVSSPAVSPSTLEQAATNLLSDITSEFYTYYYAVILDSTAGLNASGIIVTARDIENLLYLTSEVGDAHTYLHSLTTFVESNSELYPYLVTTPPVLLVASAMFTKKFLEYLKSKKSSAKLERFNKLLLRLCGAVSSQFAYYLKPYSGAGFKEFLFLKTCIIKLETSIKTFRNTVSSGFLSELDKLREIRETITKIINSIKK